MIILASIRKKITKLLSVKKIYPNFKKAA